MFRSLLVALDGTPFGEHALPLAVSVARRSGAVVELAHVHVAKRGTDTAHDELVYLDDVAGRLRRNAPDIPVRTSLLSDCHADSVAVGLAEHVAKSPVDLIVLNSHARGGLARWWMGNVAE